MSNKVVKQMSYRTFVDLSFHFKDGEMIVDTAEGIDPSAIPLIFDEWMLEAAREDSKTPK